MAEDLIRYDILIENALREVVFQAMSKVAREGLLEDHHFYITFQTTFPGVDIPGYLKKQYPDDMTIILQHQFFGLKVDKSGFSVMLSFNNVRERLSVPFKAITTFADPSVNFVLQFRLASDEGEIPHGKAGMSGGEDKDGAVEGAGAEGEKRGEVISLDSFRKK